LSSVASAKEDEIPSIPVPNVPSSHLHDMIELMEKGYEHRAITDKKEKLVESLEYELKESGWGYSVRQNKLMRLMEAANYLNAPLILRALGFAASKYKATKDVLKKYPKDLFWTIQAEYIARFKRFPFKVFEDEIVEDLRKQKLLNIDLKNQMFVPEYKIVEREEEVECGELVKISDHVKDFDETYNYIAFIFEYGEIMFLDVKTGEVKQKKISCSRDHEHHINKAVFSSRGHKIISWQSCIDKKGCEKRIYAWDVETGEYCKKAKIKGRGFQFSPCKKYFLTGDYCGTLHLFDIETGKCVKRLKVKNNGIYSKFLALLKIKERNLVNSAVFSPKGMRVASATEDKMVRIWNVQNGLLEREIAWAAREIAFSPCGKHIALLGVEVVSVYDIATGECEGIFDIPAAPWSYSFLYSPCGRYLIFGLHEMRILDLQFGAICTLKAKPKGKLSKRASAVFSPCGKHVVVVQQYINVVNRWYVKKVLVRVYSVSDGKCEMEFALPIPGDEDNQVLENSITFRKLI